MQFGPRWITQRRFLIDHSLGRLISDILRRTGWHTVYVADAFLVDDETSIGDDDIIERCAQSGLAWVTADEEARFEHAPALRKHLIDVLFVRRPPKKGMNMRYMTALIAPAIGHFEARTLSEPNYALHCRIGPSVPDQIKEIERIIRPTTSAPAVDAADPAPTVESAEGAPPAAGS